MYLVLQHSTGAPPDRQHTILKRWRSTQFIVNIFEYYELVIKLIVFPELQHFFYYHHDLKVFNNFIAF